ncbi:hypothetical protein ACQP1U_01545 [Actinomycetota bacterium]
MFTMDDMDLTAELDAIRSEDSALLDYLRGDSDGTTDPEARVEEHPHDYLITGW